MGGSGPVAGVNIAAHGSGSTTRPPTSRNPWGVFIQALAATTKNADATPATTIGNPEARCTRGGNRSQS